MDVLEGKVAVVTGAASGIGLALARAFAAEGMRVACADVERDALEHALEDVRRIGAEAVGVLCDVARPEDLERLRDEVLGAFGAVHVVCNNAGVAAGGRLWEIPRERLEWVLGVNLWGVLHGVSTFVPLLVAQGEGHVVNTASAVGLLSAPALGPYTISKHAVVALSETLAHDLALSGSRVGVSVVCPLWVRTRIAESERNAPAALARATARPSPEEERLEELFASLVAGGIDPEVVAAATVQAVREGRFCVLPHPEIGAPARARVEALLAGRLPEFRLA